MQSADSGDGLIVLKLDDGEDVIGSLTAAVKKHSIGSGIVLTGIGMLRDAEIGYFSGKGYLRKVLKEAHELVALQGSISTQGETVIHLHCSLANASHDIVGGHLFGATACVLNEITIRRTGQITLGRKLNPATGLKELTLG